METPSRFTFAPDGSTTVFQIPVQMKGDNYVRIDIDGVIINDRNKFDIVNNSIVFVNNTDVPAGSILDILVVQTDEGIANLGNVNSIDIVSQNINIINAVGTNIAAVVNNSNNMVAIQAVDANMPAVLNAAQAAIDAAASEAAAKVSENASKASENASKASENASKASEVAAENHKDAAAASATAANTSLSNTLAAELVAIQASADADTSKNAAKVSETNAAASAVFASTDASIATTKASEASTSATNAATSETNAAASASSAQASKDAALAALDNFDDRYLGQKTGDPATDNDGDPLVSGALYFNTTDEIMKVYDGSLWVAAYASLSGAMFGANNLSDVSSASDSRNNLGLGTGDTPTFAGLTVDTNTLYVDSTNNRVGIGTSSPAYRIDTAAASNAIGMNIRGDATNDRGVLRFSDSANTSEHFRLDVLTTGTQIKNNLSTPMQFFTGGSEAMRIDSSGNVGIGTSSPSDLLDLSSSDPRIRLTNTGSGYALVRTGGADASLILEADAGNTGAGSDIIMRVDGSEKMRIDSSGNVGIGTGSPEEKLHVEGSLKVDFGSAGGNPRIYLDHDSATDDGNYLQLNRGDDGLEVVGQDNVKIRTNGSEAMQIDSSGNMGIGTGSPEAILHVADNGGATDDFTAMISAFRPNLVFQDKSAATINDWEIFVDQGDMAFLYGDATTGTKLVNEAMRIDDSGNITATGTITATAFAGDGSALTGLGGISITETVLTAGTAATYTTPTDAFAIEVIVLGGGGGAGGVTGGTNEVAQSGGGGAGGGVKSLITNPDPTYTYTIGAGGGGSSSSTGGTGGTTSFGSLSATGGRGGAGSTASSLSTVAKGGSGGAGTGGDINLTGSRGMSGRCGVNPIGTADGARSLFFNASGGLAAWPTGNGGSATMWGAGGGGATIAATSGTRKGGNGAGGVIVIKEYRA